MSFWYPSGGCSNSGHSTPQQRIVGRNTGAAAILLYCAGAAGHAQDGTPPGMVANFGVEQRFEYSDNPDLEVDGDSDFFGRTILRFGLDSQRAIDRFSLGLGTDIEEGREGRDSVDLTNSFGTLSYNRQTRSARAGISLSYRESDVTSRIREEDFDQDGNVIDQTEGTRRTYNYRLDGAIGQEAPIGASFSWGENRIAYSDDADPNLQDSARQDFSGQIDFRITPRITASLTSLYRDFDARGDGVDRETTGFGSAVRLQASRVDTINIGLSYDRVERSGDQTATDEGLSGSIDWERALPNGALGVNYASDITSNDDGRRSSFSVRRTMQLPRGALSLTLGATGTDSLGTDPLVQADYVHNLPTGTVSVGLSQSVNTDNDNNEEINTRLNAAYNQQVNSLSSFGVSLSFFDRDELGETGNDAQRFDVSLSYRYALTRDWGLVGGYRHRLSTQDNAEDRSSNTVFLGVERNFSWAP
ncbi:hypothetical protein [uncultured Roseobacter sp.]|uniref:hypothetical protein n=1 Tax=uncultured Roseobacter sp. TaxID=114847 RepID=UPI00260CDA38|nr:hypothetical protein [uncultured Roseobacter sp.]